MQIDWLTVGAQIVNFLVLVWLLQRFLYGPITRAMDRRERRIAERLLEAERKKEEAETEASAYREKQEELEKQRESFMAQARASAEEEGKSLEREAREDIEYRKREWMRQLEAQREAFLRDLRRRSTEEFYALARRALADLANADLEEQIALGFVARLEGLDQEVKEKIRRGCAEAGGVATIHSRFELTANAKRHITKVLHEQIDEGLRVEYETRKEDACGVLLKAGGQTVAWSLDSYLDGFEKAVAEQLSVALTSAEQRVGE
jgi:F-type H+-transporting ATPase subunit b